jgi:hypothetical protein
LNSTETNRAGEIIAAGTAVFTAQCYELHRFPPLGGLVKTRDGDIDIFAFVCSAGTQSIEPGRRPIARGRDEASEEAVFTSSPQLEKLLRSEFSALVAGHREGDKLRQYLPPRPARIHSFVYECDAAEVREFGRSPGFLPVLLSAKLDIPGDELLAACLRRMSPAQEDPNAFLVAAGKQLASLLADDLARLMTILEKLKR